MFSHFIIILDRRGKVSKMPLVKRYKNLYIFTFSVRMKQFISLAFVEPVTLVSSFNSFELRRVGTNEPGLN